MKPTKNIDAFEVILRNQIKRARANSKGINELAAELQRRREPKEANEMPKINVSAFDEFYGFPTPANAIELAIRDHSAQAMPSHEFIAELRKAKKIVEAHALLTRALGNSTAALELYLGCGCREQPTPDVINPDGDGFDEQKIADEARALLLKVK